MNVQIRNMQGSVERPQGGAKLCPVCAHPMDEHLIDRSGKNAVLHCPAPPTAEWNTPSTAPLNELGMTRR